MVSLIGVVVIISVVVAAAWLMLGGAPAALGSTPVVWAVQLRDGKVAHFEGGFPPPGWRAVFDIATESGITGVVRYRGDGSVQFTGDISGADQQRIRNVLARGSGGSCVPGPKG